MKKPGFLIITGPTAVGKSSLAEQLATMIPIEIINGDVGQFYTDFSIGTAKPDWRNSEIPHHLFDIVDEPRDLTVFEYCQMVKDVIFQISKRGRLPVIVGGSGFYIASLFFPPKQAPFVPLQVEVEKFNAVWETLYKIDPVRALEIQKNDTYRIRRALEIWYSTGKKPSEYAPTYDPVCKNFCFVYCIRDREELYNRINKRVFEMIDAGWIEEVQKIIGTPWETFLMKKKMIGYNDILLYLHKKNYSDIEREKMINEVAQHTRRYAKRQITFFRMLFNRVQKYASPDMVQEINLSHIKPDSYLGILTKKLNLEM